MGFIDSVTAPFCESCNRIRLTAGRQAAHLSLLVERTRHPRPDARRRVRTRTVANLLCAAVSTKELKHHITDGLFVKPKRTMSQIGG